MSANLTADDVAVTVDIAQDISVEAGGRAGENKVYAVLAFGKDNGDLTYPANGVPLPEPGFFAMNRKVPLKWMNLRQQVLASANTLWVYDDTVRTGAPYGTLRGVVISSGAELATNATVVATTLGAEVLGT